MANHRKVRSAKLNRTLAIGAVAGATAIGFGALSSVNAPAAHADWWALIAGPGSGNGSSNGNGQPGTRQLIHRDFPGQGVLYIPNAEVTAGMKTAPTGAGYVGLGEKAGARSLKNNFTFTFFNFEANVLYHLQLVIFLANIDTLNHRSNMLN